MGHGWFALQPRFLGLITFATMLYAGDCNVVVENLGDYLKEQQI